MASDSSYTYLTKYYAKRIEEDYAASTPAKFRDKYTYKGFGEEHKQLNYREIAILGQFFDKLICRNSVRLVLVDGNGDLYAYNGEYYEKHTSGIAFVMELIKRTMEELGISSYYIFFAPKIIAQNLMRSITNNKALIFNPNRRYIVFTNGVLDLKTGNLNQFSNIYVTDLVLDIAFVDYETLMRASTGVTVNANVCKLWEAKIAEIIPDKENLQAFQQFCGSLLVNRDEIKIEYVCYLFGSGANGKSVAANAIASVFGDKYFSTFTPKQLFKDSDARVNIAALEGKICNLVGDLEEKDISGGDFKRFVSGEKFQGRRNYKDPIQVKAPPLLCCTNTMPETSDDTWGYYRRQLTIATTMHQFTDKDKDPMLSAKFATTEARQRIFLWIYEGYKKIIANGGIITLGDEVLQAQTRLQQNSSSQRRWFRDSGLKVPKKDQGEWIPLTMLVREYLSYCDEMNESQRVDGRKIMDMLMSLGFERKRRRDGTMVYVTRSVEEEGFGDLIKE